MFTCHFWPDWSRVPPLISKTSHISPTNRNASRYCQNNFIQYPATKIFHITHPAFILSPIPHPAKPILNPYQWPRNDLGYYQIMTIMKLWHLYNYLQLVWFSFIEIKFKQRSKKKTSFILWWDCSSYLVALPVHCCKNSQAQTLKSTFAGETPYSDVNTHKAYYSYTTTQTPYSHNPTIIGPQGYLWFIFERGKM